MEYGFLIGAGLLGLGIAYGLFRYHRRDRTKDALTEAATRRLYKDPER